MLRGVSAACVLAASPGDRLYHATLGGLLFTLNAAGYLVAAAPSSSRSRWRALPLGVRLGRIGYAVTTILGWAIQGPFYQTGYIAEAIEVALIVLVAVDFARMDGNPIAVAKRDPTRPRDTFSDRSPIR